MGPGAVCLKEFDDWDVGVSVCFLCLYSVIVFIGSDQEPVRDFGTERALVEPLGPIYIDFPSLSPRFTLLTELNLT